MSAKKIKAKSDHVFGPDSVFDLIPEFGSPSAFTSNPVFNPETCIQPKPHTKPKPRIRPYRQDSGHAFEHRIANVLNKNGIKAYVFPSEQGDNGIDVIATFNRQIILIQCKNTVKPIGVKILRDFQASVHRFGDAILSVIVYNSEKLKYNPLTKPAETWWKGSCPEICIKTERTIVDCIKKKIARENFKLIEELELEQESSEVESESEQESFESESESEQELLYFEEGNTRSAKQINYRNGQNNKPFIENLLDLLNENAIITNIFPQRRGDNGIDIIATFNRKIILIKCINFNSPVYDNVLRNFQTSIYRFGEGILNIIVYNSEESDKHLIRNKGSHSKVKILNEKTIINYIKNNLTKKTPDHSKSSRNEYDELLDDILNQFDQSVSHNDTPVMDRQQVLRSPELRRTTPSGNMKVDEVDWENHNINSVERVRNDVVYYLGEQFNNDYEYDNGKLLNNVVKAPYGGNSSRVTTPDYEIPKTNNDSWSCPKCTFDNIQLMSRCEICLTDRPDTQQSQSFTPIEPTEPTEPSSPQWSCPQCTFMNESDVIMCIACDYFKDD